MFQNGQTQFRNLAKNVGRFLKFDHFGNLRIERLKISKDAQKCIKNPVKYL